MCCALSHIIRSISTFPTFFFQFVDYTDSVLTIRYTIMNLIPIRRTTAAAAAQRTATRTLNVSGRLQALASFAQQRVWLHEKLYFSHDSSSLAIYNILVPLTIKRGSLSVERIRLALLSVLDCHTVLRTAVRFNGNSGQLEQEIQPLSHDLYSFECTSNINSSEQLDAMLTSESVTNHFNLEEGKVVRCHLMLLNKHADQEMLREGDLIIFSLHHIAFDMSSVGPFINTFTQACNQNKSVEIADRKPQYIDVTLYEQALLQDPNTTGRAQRFWSTLLRGYDWTKKFLQLVPLTQTLRKVRSGRGYSRAFTLDPDLVHSQMLFASSHNISMFQLYLACYYMFIYTLDGSCDLCITGATDNRRLLEMRSMVGMFVNLIPYRIQLNPGESFVRLALQVQQLCLSILEYNHLPYQYIINAEGHERQPMSQLFFEYESRMSSITHGTALTFDVNDEDNTMLAVYNDRDRLHGNGVALFDITLTMSHSHSEKATNCFLECSADLFDDQSFVDILANNFQHMLGQLFVEHQVDLISNPINQLSLCLPTAADQIKRLAFVRHANTSEGMRARNLFERNDENCHCLFHLGPASFAQAQMWLDDRLRFGTGKSKVAMCNMSFLYRIETGTLSITRLCHALQLVIMKHHALRTALFFDSDNQELVQRILQPQQNEQLFTFVDSTFETEDNLVTIMHDERGNPSHFDLAKGIVCRLHVVRRNSTSNDLDTGDAIIFNFHHAMFDFPSMPLFHRDLEQAYLMGELQLDDDNQLRYLDCEYKCVLLLLLLTVCVFRCHWRATNADVDGS